MGRRARAQGITGAALRAARRDRDRHDGSARTIAQRVYNVAHEAKTSGEAGDVSPLLWAPLVVAAEMAAVVVCKAGYVDDTEEMRQEVAAYFVAGFIAGAQRFDREHFEKWRSAASEAAGAEEMEPG